MAERSDNRTDEQEQILIRAAEGGAFDAVHALPPLHGVYVDAFHPGRCRLAAEIATGLLGEPVADYEFAVGLPKFWTAFHERVGTFR